MNNQGFTLMELLITVLILGILTSVAVPQYTRSLERSRATEAMTGLKALNDAVYAYAAERDSSDMCPRSFRKLLISLPGEISADGSTITTNDFVYTLGGATGALVPGTDCPGVLASRRGGTKYDYIIWNPYVVGTAGKGTALACTSPGGKASSLAVCESLNLYTVNASPYLSVENPDEGN